MTRQESLLLGKGAYLCEDNRQIVLDFIIAETDHAIAILLQDFGPRSILLGLRFVDRAIKFDDKFTLATIE